MITKIKSGLKLFYRSYAWLGLLLLLLDLVSKLVIQHYVAIGQEITLIPKFLYLTLTYNKGAAWSILDSDAGHIVLTVISWLAFVGILGYFIVSYKKTNLLQKAIIMCLLAGTIGNGIDRTFYEDGVIDFIGVYLFYPNRFPIFNLADCCLVVGIIILLVYIFTTEIRIRRRKRKLNPPSNDRVKSQSEKEDDGEL
ncbi:MAG: signal peptidase II [Erysipelotrichaceae bacterium]|jgi:signal peptidase II|nr:signal peptidase II [Erysipelotrichaceae bacterium]